MCGPYLLVITCHTFNFNIILHPSSVEVMNKWRCNSTPPKCFRGVDRDNFKFTFTPADPKWSVAVSFSNLRVENI